ncbi:protein sidekick-1-like [Haemaphysalis longicornis]
MGHTHASPWSASLMSVAVLLLVERHQSAGQDQVERIDCQTNATSTNCPLGKVCSVTCPADCPKKVTVYGTQFYRYDSPICAAAGHDLRLSPWNERSLSVAFIRSDRKLRRYKGSYRNGFTSLSAEELDEQNTHKGWYSFISPRITEPIFDLTSVHVHYRHRPNETHVQICFGPPGRQVTFSHFGRTLSPYPTPTEHDGVFKLVWPVGDNGASSGAFVCAVQGSVLSSATSVAMPRMRNFLSALSQTINLYETAQLKNANGEGGVWSKDGLTLGRPVVKNNNSEVEVTPATLGDGGLYMFRAKGADFEQVSRLIVRACEDGKYGHVCAEACPRCRNGGVCHDITGVCICPPGFTGEHCETPCKPYHFGQNCSHNCTEVQSLAKGSDPKCAGLLFCLPDPYGCSCYPGFYGIDCTTRYLVLHNFSVVAVDEESIEAEWSPWSPKVDKGEGKPDGYIIQFKELDRMEWNRTDLIPDPGNGTLSYAITGLKPNTDYQVQVLVHDTSGHVHYQTAHTERTKTRCGAPLSPPHSFTYEEKPSRRTTELKWQLPRMSEWQCDYVSTEVRVNDGEPSVTAATQQTFPTTPFTAYRIQARLVTQGGKYGPFSDPFEFTTAEAVSSNSRVPAPKEVSSLSLLKRTPKVYQLQWKPPTVTNGNLRFYHLRIGVIGLYLRNCPDFQAPEIVNASVPANVTSIEVRNVTAGATYSVSIQDTTVEDGPWRDYYFVTAEEVPEAPPRLDAPQVGDRSALVSWREPDCLLANGVITGYRLVRSSTADWEPIAVSSEVAANTVTMNDLTPFTEYTVTIFAENSVGTGPGANVTFTTLPAAPPPPTNLTVYNASSQQLLVSWLPPHPPNGELERYVVRVKPVEEDVFPTNFTLTPGNASCDSEVRAGHHCAVLSPLLPNKAYQVLVTAKNMGLLPWSERSNMITAKTPESSYLVLHNFSVVAVDEESIEAEWSPWSPKVDKGEGKPDGYIIQFKELDRMEWNRTDLIPDPGNGTLSYVITGLKPNTDYQVQVLVHDTSGHVHYQTAHTERTKTRCGAPLSPPHSFTYEEKPSRRTTELKWQLPRMSEWQCDYVSTEVRVNDGEPSVTAATQQTFPTTPFTAYRIQARLVTQGGKYGPFSDPFEFTTAEAAPKEVFNLSLSELQQSPKVYQLQWKPPTVTNGILRFYHLRIRVIGLYQRNCPEFQAPEIVNVSVPANLTSIEVRNVTAGASYRVSIQATTVEDGPWRDYYFVTAEEVPEAPPRLDAPQVGDRWALVSWREPDCRLANGVITGYRLVRSSTADWEPIAVSSKVAANSVTMNDLTPFTEYTVTIFAENSAGTGPSAKVTFTTFPAAPPPPTNLTVYNASSQQLLVSWLPPHPPNGELERYVVRVKPVEEDVFPTNFTLTPGNASCDSEVRAGHHCAVLSPLLPNKAYQVLVTAKNMGVLPWSERSNMITAKTPESSYLVLHNFSVVAVDEESIEAEWSPWSPKVDKGEGKPDGYIIQFKELDRMEWNRTDLIPDPGNGTLSYMITGLKPNTDYQVQVLVHDTSGHVHYQTAHTERTKTRCGAPLSPPHSFTYEEKPSRRTTELKWQLPRMSEWQCDYVSTEVRVNDGEPSVTAATQQTFPTTPFTAYRIQARLVTQGGKYGPFSDPFEFTTAEAVSSNSRVPAPKEVSSLSLLKRSPKVYQLQWKPPTVTNGNLRFYHLRIGVIGLYLRNCPDFQAPEIVNASVPANVTSIEVRNVTAGATYRVSIQDTTVEDGPWRDYYFVTAEEVPEAPPRLDAPQVGDRWALVSWREPDCRLANGVITGYRLVRSSTADWEPSAVSTEVATNNVTMNDLTPFTEYTVTVSAKNSVGTGPGANVTFTTLPAAPPPPNNLTVYSASSQQLLISWLPPYPPNGELEGYVVRVKPVEEDVFSTNFSLTPWAASCDSEVRAGHHCAVLSPLLPNKAYQVLVTAKNKGVLPWSERSNMITAKTRESSAFAWSPAAPVGAPGV